MKGVNYSLESFMGPINGNRVDLPIINAIKRNKNEVIIENILI